jgi:LmbE family N-acetylglucosaminyl deacetylase
MTQRRILVVAAHPDDEILGVGGAIAKHADAGDEVHIFIVAEGHTSRAPVRNVAADQQALNELRQVAREAAALLGARPPLFAGMPDNRLDSVDLLDVTKAVEAVVQDVRPALVYTHHAGDLNIDHGIVQRAVLTACRPLPPSTVNGVFCFETVSSTEWGSVDQAFAPSHYVNIESTLSRKLAALKCYRGEMREFPHARSMEAVEALARLRGAQCGVSAAEAFVVARTMWR